MRHALRYWSNHKSAVVWLVVSVASALGVATAALSINRALLWRELPFKQADHLLVVTPLGIDGDEAQTFPEEFVAIRRRQNVLHDLASYQLDFPTTVRQRGAVERVSVARVTGNLFDVLGVAAQDGRLFRPADVVAGRFDLAVVSHAAAWRLFGSSAEAIGATLRLMKRGKSDLVTIVGVLPSGFLIQDFYPGGIDVLLAVPDGLSPPIVRSRGWNSRYLIARRRPDVSLEAAQESMATITREVGANTYSPKGGVRLVPLREALFGGARPTVIVVNAVAVLTLVVACVNASGLALVLMARRSVEMATRHALGATRGHLLIQGLIEGSLLAGVMALGSTGVAKLIQIGAVTVAPPTLAQIEDVSIGWSEAGFVLVAGICVGLGYVLVGGYGRRGIALTQIFGGSGRPTISRATMHHRRTLIGAQVAAVLVLVVAGMVSLASYWRLSAQPLGFESERVLVATFDTPAGGLERGFVETTQRRLEAVPEIGPVAFSAEVPLAPFNWSQGYSVGPDRRRVRARGNQVTADYFDLLAIPLIAGRTFLAGEPSGDEAVVNEMFADRYLGGVGFALGQRVQTGTRVYTVVGVVANAREQPLTAELGPVVYQRLMASEATQSALHLLVKSVGSLRATEEATKEILQTSLPDAFVDSGLLKDRFREQSAVSRLLGFVISGIAAVGVVLSCFGTFVLVSQFSHERRREIAIRCALGCDPHGVARTVLRPLAVPVIVGVLGGLTASLWAVRVLEVFLFETNMFSMVAWSIGTVGLLLVIGLAAWVPARTSAKLDISRLLRDS
jgi:predicted permease